MNIASDVKTGIRRAIRNPRRRGNIIVLSAVLMVFIVGIMAFTIDVGYLCMARSQAQNCADAAALAAGLEMVSNARLKENTSTLIARATQKARDYGAVQDINHSVISSDLDGPGEVIESVSFGRLENPSNINEPMSFSDPNHPNAVRVQVTCDPERNTAVPLFFARIFGMDTSQISASATVTFSSGSTVGFEVPENGPPCTLMPFVINEDDWDNMLAGSGEDNWSYNPDTGAVTAGPDGIREIKMFPDKDNGNHGNGNNHGQNSGITPGNFGLVDIGPSHGVPAIREQITNGPSHEDLEPYGGSLELDPVTGTLEIGGEPGIKAGIKDAVANVIGLPKTIMLYNDAVGQGANTTFTVCRFVGVRVMDYRLTGSASSKYILVQPAMVQDPTAVTGGEGNTSDFVGQPIQLVR
ncbi:MAG: hypothetical protein JW888_01500 [Pirellulales bacterium]|nr:hypothetical protein [Pirellulales bacterium]